ncbi:MAG: phage tail tape measure protein [Allorhizobium sp.]
MREVEARLKISAVDRTGRVMKNVGDKLGYISQRADQYNRSMSTIGRYGPAVANFISRLGPAAFAGLGAGLAYSAKEAAKFEESLFGIQKKSGATAEEMRKIAEEIQTLATEVPVSIDEIASAFERGAAAGVPLDELKEFAKITAQVADAWDTTAENVGNTFAGFSAGMGLDRKDLLSYASLINDLADAGIADETGIADFIDRAGASLKNFGLSPEEIAAYGAALANLKLPSEVGARAMDTLTGKLAAPENLSKKSRTALGKIVGDLKSFGKLAGDQKLIHFLSRLDKMTGRQRTSLLGALLGEGFDDEVSRMVGGFAEIERNLAAARKHVEAPSNSIVDAAAKKLELFNSQMTIMGSNIKNIATDLGDTFLPTLTEIAKEINDTLKEAREGGKARQKAVEGLSDEEKRQQVKWFVDRYHEASPSEHQFAGINRYDEALEMVGRGDLPDLESYIARIRQQTRYLEKRNAESTGRHSAQAVQGPDLQQQYRTYGYGRQLFDAAPKPVLDELAVKVGQELYKMNQGQEQAPWLSDLDQKISSGSQEGGAALKDAAQSLVGAAGQMVGMIGAMVQKVSQVAATGGAVLPPVNANTGRSMPPSAGRPAGTGRQ